MFRDELRWEREALDRSYEMLMDHDVAPADMQISVLDTLFLGQLRIWMNWRDPYERLLRGTIKVEQGDYGSAIRYLHESHGACVRGRFDRFICKALDAEILFRQANASIFSRQRRALNMAMKYLEQGLLIDSDDVFAKKTLDWLKILQENAEEGQDSRDNDPGHGDKKLDKNQKPGQGGGAMRKGY
ncbi:MAG: hypothetical protein Q8R30_01010 [bacterium]|nr:hypothetical protein [bacterium]